MPEETETVTGNPAQEQNNGDQKDSTDGNSADNQNIQHSEVPQVSQENTSQPSVEGCILKTSAVSEAQSGPPAGQEDSESHSQTWFSNSRPKSPEVQATEAFLLHEQGSSESTETITKQQIPQEASVITPEVPEPEIVPVEVPEKTEPRTPVNSEASESNAPSSGEEPQESAPAQAVEISNFIEVGVVSAVEHTTVNGDVSTPEEPPREPPKEIKASLEVEEIDAPQCQLTNGQSNGECKLEPRKVPEPEPHHVEREKVLIDAIANELIAEDYKLPDVVEVKKHFEYHQPAYNDVSVAPPKKGALSTRIDAKKVKQAYEDVRYDGSETEWAVFKFEGPTIVVSGTGSDFTQFKDHFGEDDRAFGYIRVQTGDEMSKRAKFLFVTWVGPSVSVLKRAKMSTDKALMKDILTNFAVELQTENIADINLQNFVTELDKAAGAHYGTGVRG